MNNRISRGFGLIVLTTLALAGCGRKGPLEMPPTTTPAEARVDAAQQTRVLPAQDSPALIQQPTRAYDKPTAEKLKDASQKPSHAINGPEQTPKKPFVLDPLL